MKRWSAMSCDQLISALSDEQVPRKDKTPVAISYNTAPNENRSVRASSSFPLTCSGDIYATVPSVEPRLSKWENPLLGTKLRNGVQKFSQCIQDTVWSPLTQKQNAPNTLPSRGALC